MPRPELQVRYGPPTYCPKCEARTAYLRVAPSGTFRRCDNPTCGHTYRTPEPRP